MCNFHAKRLQKTQQLLQYKRHVWEGWVGWVEMCNFHAKRLQKTKWLLQYKRHVWEGWVGWVEMCNLHAKRLQETQQFSNRCTRNQEMLILCTRLPQYNRHMSGREWQGRTHVQIERLQKKAAVWADAV